MYDLIVMPINLKDGRQVQPKPGLKVVSAPRRAVRSRSEDILILSLTVDDSDQFYLQTQESWLDNLVQSFFKTSGSVTTALRMLIESINLTMLEQNLKLAKDGKTATGAINLMAIHRQAVYIVQSGLTHAYVLNHEAFDHFYDTNQTDRGLGLSRTPAIRYFQADLGKGAYVFITDTPPKSWTEEGLFPGEFPNRDQLRRRLLNQAPGDFSLALIEVQPGEGKIETIAAPVPPSATQIADEPPDDLKREAVEGMDQVVLNPKADDTNDSLEDTQEIKPADSQVFDTDTTTEGMEEEAMQSEEDSHHLDAMQFDELSESAAEAEAEAEAFESLDKLDEQAEVVEPEASTSPEEIEEIEATEKPEESQQIQPTQDEELRSGSPTEQQAYNPVMTQEEKVLPGSQEKPVRERAPRQPKRNLSTDVENFKRGFKHWKNRTSDGVLNGLSDFFKWWHTTREKISGFFNKLISGSSIGQRGPTQLSRGTMLFIAVMVPLAVVVIAVGFYLARGRSQQYDYYYEQAQVASANALAAMDPITKQTYWSETLTFLDQAEAVRETNEIDQLRDQAQNALDSLEGAIRLAYQPAITGVLNEDILITRIVSYGSDLYLLDAAAGQVIHAVMGDQGYEIDLEFSCEPGSYTGGFVDPFVDMVSMPINNPFQAQILAVDASGGIAFCGKGQDPIIQTLPSQGLNAREIKRVAYDVNYLYALDTLASNILVFRPDNYQFIEPPTLYFEGEDLADKPDLSQIVDLAVNGSDLYLLRTDGMIVNCRTSGFSENPVTCENPVTYVDGRAGREEQAVVMPNSNFSAILYTAPPDPALSILNTDSADIYRLSLRFRLYQRLRPELGDFELGSTTATAFTIGSNRFAYIAFGNQVFYAYIE